VKSLHAIVVGAALFASAAANAQSVRFISCPIYRDADAGRKSGCWLSDDIGTLIRYDVSRSPSLPDWNFEILVEGNVANAAANPCGGVVLDPVRVSILPGHCTRHLLPAEGFPGRRFVLPSRNVRPLAEPRPPLSDPAVTKTFHIMFDFNRSFLVYQLSDYLLDQAITYIRQTNPTRIIVTGYAATSPTSVSGRSISEDSSVARTRALLIRESLLRLGVPANRIEMHFSSGAQPTPAEGADGLAEPSRRRADIRVVVDRPG
jgi:outer membrane protein OmpA-like peptidoglycan-associated protein